MMQINAQTQFTIFNSVIQIFSPLVIRVMEISKNIPGFLFRNVKSNVNSSKNVLSTIYTLSGMSTACSAYALASSKLSAVTRAASELSKVASLAKIAKVNPYVATSATRGNSKPKALVSPISAEFGVKAAFYNFCQCAIENAFRNMQRQHCGQH